MFAAFTLAASMVGGVLAADAQPKKQFSEKQLAQQQRMTDCAADAKQKALRGDDRMAFMKTCLSGGQVTAEVGDESASVPDRKASAHNDK
ncbi:MAG: PsiF family protein [Stagnimonas sp.]|nr:PsiF family protein [Stagnimonas sp.]